MKRRCPVCLARTLTVRDGIAGLFVLCRNACPREQIVAGLNACASLPETADALGPGGHGPGPNFTTTTPQGEGHHPHRTPRSTAHPSRISPPASKKSRGNE